VRSPCRRCATAPTATMTRAEAARRVPLRPGERIAIVAGGGKLPLDVAESLAASGHPPFVVMVEGEANPALASFDHVRLSLERLADLGSVLKREGVTKAVFAGAIDRRPKLTAMRPSLNLLRFLPRVIAGLARGD